MCVLCLQAFCSQQHHGLPHLSCESVTLIPYPRRDKFQNSEVSLSCGRFSSRNFCGSMFFFLDFIRLTTSKWLNKQVKLFNGPELYFINSPGD